LQFKKGKLMSPEKVVVHEAKSDRTADWLKGFAANEKWQEPEQNELRIERLGEVLESAQEDATRWLVDQRLPVGGSSILGGKPKVGKSTLARCLALAVARGDRWLGFETQQACVLYLALEEKRSEVGKHFALMGANEADPIALVFPPLTKARGALEKAVLRDKPGLVIIDPLVKGLIFRDMNEYAPVSRELEPLLQLARETGAHIMAVHHTSKSKIQSGGESLLGSQALFGGVDTVLVLMQHGKYLTLSSEQRYGEGLSEMTLTQIPETRMFVPCVTLSEAREQSREVEFAEKITEYLRTQAEGVEVETILQNVGGRKADKENALRRLVEKKQVDTAGQGVKGKPFLYSLPKSKAETFTIGGRGASLPPKSPPSQAGARLSASAKSGAFSNDSNPSGKASDLFLEFLKGF